MLVNFVTVVHILICVILILVILLQSSKQQGITGVISGGAETFFGKNKGRSFEGKLAKATSICMVLFIVTSISLVVLSGQ